MHSRGRCGTIAFAFSLRLLLPGTIPEAQAAPGCLEVALHFIDAVMKRGFDVAHSEYLWEGQAITHAITCVCARII